MDWEKAHAEADEALNKSTHKIIGIAPFLKEHAESRKLKIVNYDGFLLLENRGINLSHVREIVIAPITEQYSVLRKWIPIQIGYQILIIYKENVHIVYKEYKLSKAYTDELTDYFKGASEQYQINVKPIIGNALKQLETVVDYEFKTLFNTIQR